MAATSINPYKLLYKSHPNDSFQRVKFTNNFAQVGTIDELKDVCSLSGKMTASNKVVVKQTDSFSLYDMTMKEIVISASDIR